MSGIDISKVMDILVPAFNAAVDLEPSIVRLIGALRSHPQTSDAVKAQLDELDARLQADEDEADNLPPVPDPVPTVPNTPPKT